MEELREGLWWWTAPHLDWTPEQGGPDGWQRYVSSYAFDCGDTFVLVDPQSPPSVVDELAAGRHVAVVLTTLSHRRSADEVVARIGAHVYEPGDRLPEWIEAKPSYWADDETPLWVGAYGALVFGDSLLGEPDGLRLPDAWLPETFTHEQAAASLRPLLDLPVAHVLPTHGRPGARVDLERALG